MASDTHSSLWITLTIIILASIGCSSGLFNGTTLSVANGPTCQKIGICSCEMSDGTGIIDLHPLSSNTNTPRFQGVKQAGGTNFLYDYNPCKPFSMGKCKNVLVCQVYTVKNTHFDIGSSMNPAYDTDKKKFQFVYDSKDAGKQTFITLSCDEKAEAAKLNPFLEEPLGIYHTTLTSKYACPRKISPSKANKVSIGTILCILLLVGFVLYFSIGIVVNRYYRKKQGSELIPNVGFWKDAPFLIKDGGLFCWMKARRRQTEYEKI